MTVYAAEALASLVTCRWHTGVASSWAPSVPLMVFVRQPVVGLVSGRSHLHLGSLSRPLGSSGPLSSRHIFDSLVEFCEKHRSAAFKKMATWWEDQLLDTPVEP